jgi:hypothetical protein
MKFESYWKTGFSLIRFFFVAGQEKLEFQWIFLKNWIFRGRVFLKTRFSLILLVQKSRNWNFE